MLDHFFSDFEIGNHAIFHGPNGHNMARRTAQHIAGIITDGMNHLAAIANGKGHHGWLVENDITPFGVDKRVGCAQVNRDVGGKHVQQ